ncbi:hypothetical protein SLEP1_g52237 [Rubroshorea leprosula]|uniref:Uncharacterized protein n=1 Tax=Rubroshorea leprosula TaxID=152421 RepID=A0AAV5M9D8_9ROSI|nr:hypothetical protein SLEP1_g52237 [Rubroshorea leprosula]
MGKQSRQISKILTILPRAASPINFQVSPPWTPPRSPTYSPARKVSPAVSLVPKEARTKSKNDSFQTQEPTSPKISCMGQIKGLKRKQKKMMNKPPPPEPTTSHEKGKRKPLLGLKFFKGKKQDDKVSAYEYKPSVKAGMEPSFRDIKRFASGRGVLSGFD